MGTMNGSRLLVFAALFRIRPSRDRNGKRRFMGG